MVERDFNCFERPEAIGFSEGIGSSAIRKRLEEWYSSFKGLIGHEIAT